MIVTEAQINRLHRGGRVELTVDFRPKAPDEPPSPHGDRPAHERGGGA